MSTALFTDHIIHAGITDVGMRYCQFWGTTKVAAGLPPAQVCFAAMEDRAGAVTFMVRPYCPRDLIPEVLEAYQTMLAGGDVPRTHDCVWRFGQPTFTPILVAA